jgi:hypothetical protein
VSLIHTTHLRARPKLRDTLFEVLAIADDLVSDDDHDYAPLLASTGFAVEQLEDLKEAPVALPLFQIALQCLNEAAHPTRWRWLAVVASLRPMLEVHLEGMDAALISKQQRARMA